MRWGRSRKAVQRVFHKGLRRPVGNVWERKGHRRENCTSERHAFQETNRSFDVALTIASWTAGHVGLIRHRHCSRRWRHDGFAGCREHGNRNCDQSDQNRSDKRHSATIKPYGPRFNQSKYIDAVLLLRWEHWTKAEAPALINVIVVNASPALG